MSVSCKKCLRDLDRMRRLALKYAIQTKEEVQLYSYKEGNQILYNFEPINKERKSVIEYIDPLI